MSSVRSARLRLWQEARFDDFIEIFSNERPHEALDMKCPAEVYQPSTRAYKGLPDIDYPFHDKIIIVTNCGRICLGHKKINFSTVFAGQAVGIKEVHDDIWLVSFRDYGSGILRSGDSRGGTARKFLRPKGVTYVAGTLCNPCVRAGPSIASSCAGNRFILGPDSQ
jgi:hypothetical protein